jgi:hypothetical protein
MYPFGLHGASGSGWTPRYHDQTRSRFAAMGIATGLAGAVAVTRVMSSLP